VRSLGFGINDQPPEVREDGVIRSQAVMIAIGVDWEGRRNVLSVELSNRESRVAGKSSASG
jgi:transposase-like protein